MYQKLVLVGNLGRDPELHYSADGVPITNFSVATHQKWSDSNGEPQQETVWFRVATFGKQAEVCQEYLTKGHKVLVEGTLIADAQNGGPRLYTRKDGSVGTAFEVRAMNVRFLNSRADRPGGASIHDPEADGIEQEPLFS